MKQPYFSIEKRNQKELLKYTYSNNLEYALLFISCLHIAGLLLFERELVREVISFNTWDIFGLEQPSLTFFQDFPDVV